jgi:hypothetical protein
MSTEPIIVELYRQYRPLLGRNVPTRIIEQRIRTLLDTTFNLEQFTCVLVRSRINDGPTVDEVFRLFEEYTFFFEKS